MAKTLLQPRVEVIPKNLCMSVKLTGATRDALDSACRDKNMRIATLLRGYLEYCLREEGYLEAVDVPSLDNKESENDTA